MKKILLVLNIPLMLLGCAAIKNNVTFPEPKDGERARIRVIIPKVFNDYRGSTGYPNSQCLPKNLSGGGHIASSYLFGFEKNLNGQKIGIPTTTFSEKKGFVAAEAYLSANRPVIFTFLMPAGASTMSTGTTSYTRYYQGCMAKVGFTPRVNADYELIFPSSGSCQFELSRLIVDKDTVLARPITTDDVRDCD
ncbi:hypothetical protein RGU75_07225 [Glaciimonas sp. CA11.2]|uniref:hypothetical protein n=2 Tax=Glaciimonas sp. CA11.2 TaxID=3048601 RepID=UPI002AB47419|nr:hypothetical protein [Glaciimonas sp. CA11.2]MDY7546020.1 hypothetical protein [Glaciimonas sp. CA11.2]